MSGSLLALLGAVFFAASRIPLRRGLTDTGESFSAVAYSVFTGVVLFSLLAFVPGDRAELARISLKSYALLATAGVTAFVLGRALEYTAVRLIGNNIAAPLARVSIVVAVVSGILVLGESLTMMGIWGVVLILAGVILVSISGEDGKVRLTRGNLIRGIAAGLGAGICWGASTVLIRAGIQDVDSPFVAAFISYMAALAVIASSLLHKGRRLQLNQVGRSSLIALLLNGVFVSVAQLLRYLALDITPASIVQPIMSTSLLFLLLFSFALNRNVEVFTWKVVLGVVAVVAGAVLIY